MNTEEQIIYDITTNVCNPDYAFAPSNYAEIDWKRLL